MNRFTNIFKIAHTEIRNPEFSRVSIIFRAASFLSRNVIKSSKINFRLKRISRILCKLCLIHPKKKFIFSAFK